MNTESAKEYQHRTENAIIPPEAVRQVGKAAIEQLNRYMEDHEPKVEFDEPGPYNPLDPYSIPDDEDSLKALSLVREIESHSDQSNDQKVNLAEDIDEANLVDDFCIPDEKESVEALLQTRELEKNYNQTNKLSNGSNQLPLPNAREYKITEKELERLANITGQSEETILLESHWTRDDVESSVENN
jgi:hypothetical protein